MLRGLDAAHRMVSGGLKAFGVPLHLSRVSADALTNPQAIEGDPSSDWRKEAEK